MAVTAPDELEFRDEMQRVLDSNTMRSAESLRRLLAYLGEAYLSGNQRNLKEYTIGRDVMGKPDDYDPRVDASVRVQIGKLRQRLDQYYAAEAPESQRLIRLPKGHFELVLERRPEPAPVIPSALSPPIPDTRWRSAAFLLGAAAIGFAVLAAVLWFRPAPRQSVAKRLLPEVESFWAPFFGDKRPLTVVLGSPLFVRFHSTYYRDPVINEWSEAQKLPLDEMQRLLGSPTEPSETRRWTPFGEAAAAFRLALFLGSRGEEVVLKRSTVLAWEDIRSANLIFLGPRKFNPQLRDLPVEQDFFIEQGQVVNARPRAGEAASYRKPSAPNVEDIPEDYAVITRVHGVEGWGEILVLASTSTEGTWAAADFITEPSQLQGLQRRLRLENGSLPNCYQVLVKSRFKSQVPIQTEYVTHHVIKPKSVTTHGQ